MPSTVTDLAALVDRWAALRGAGRVLVGLAGAPGAGKTTIAAAAVAALAARGIRAASVPMDGFHLADVTLERLGRAGRKGALDTFDVRGYLSLLGRLRNEPEHAVYAPGFERTLEQPIAAALTVDPDVEVVVTEGNYLLVDDDPWREIPHLLDEVWFVEADDALRIERLCARHELFGKTPAEARAWVAEVDEPNARITRASASRATGRIRL
jgi:pantothenate kinase